MDPVLGARGRSARVARSRGYAAFTLYAGSLTAALLSLAGVLGDERMRDEPLQHNPNNPIGSFLIFASVAFAIVMRG
ncbi:hypothetical protein [Streptomyces sp. NPDC047981]|uniref:hypothetical protein n=1 Tax=Streptomyces sp. NPDC047981 TaxID=3154610 RepID=UPI003417AC11